MANTQATHQINTYIFVSHFLVLLANLRDLIHHYSNWFRYHTLTVPEEEAANCLLINGSLLVPHMSEIPLSSEVKLEYQTVSVTSHSDHLLQVFKQRIPYPIKEIALSEFQKTGRGLSSLCILIRKSKNIKKLWLVLLNILLKSKILKKYKRSRNTGTLPSAIACSVCM